MRDKIYSQTELPYDTLITLEKIDGEFIIEIGKNPRKKSHRVLKTIDITKLVKR